MYDRLKEFTPMERHAVEGTRFLFLCRGVKHKDVATSSGMYVTTLSNLINSKLNWNFQYLSAISDYLRIAPDELLKTGRILAGLPDGIPGRPELEGPRAGSFERFSLIYNSCAGGTLMAAHYPAKVIWARVPGAAAAYGKGKITDAQMRAACASLVRRVLAAPDSDIWAVFGLLD